MYWHESAENDPPNRWLREEIRRVVAESLPTIEPELKLVGSSAAKKRPGTRAAR